jgi:FixJ family two-component response regulator
MVHISPVDWNDVRPHSDRVGEATTLESVIDPITNRRALVCIVDDNQSVRESLPDLLEHAGYDVQTFESAEAFLASPAMAEASCLILDVGLPGMSGPELHKELLRRGQHIAVVFITAQGDRSLPARLIAAGAVACLLKPFSDTALLEALQRACIKG